MDALCEVRGTSRQIQKFAHLPLPTSTLADDLGKTSVESICGSVVRFWSLRKYPGVHEFEHEIHSCCLNEKIKASFIILWIGLKTRNFCSWVYETSVFKCWEIVYELKTEHNSYFPERDRRSAATFGQCWVNV